MSAVLPIIAATSSAAAFGLSTSLQHREAGAAPEGSVALVAHLLRRPLWLFGLAVSVIALGLYALAVGTGPLGLVQPILISGIVFALPIRAAFDRTVPTRRQVGHAALTTAGLAVFLVATSPTPGSHPADGLTALMFVAAGVPVAGILARGGMAASGRRSGLLLGSAAGIALGLMAACLKLTVSDLSSPAALVTHWPLWAFVGLAGWGTLLNQHAYREAPLATSMPIVNIVGPLIGIAFAGLVFGELPGHRPIDILLELVGIAAMVFGLHGLGDAEGPTDPAVDQPVASLHLR